MCYAVHDETHLFIDTGYRVRSLLSLYQIFVDL
jgi:hypothetical protein